MIKSGGENIYPVEIERVLLADQRIGDAVVVQNTDPKWSEMPVAFIEGNGDSLTEEEVVSLCRTNMARYKCPREVRFIKVEDLPCSTSGKIQRHEIEEWL